MPFYFLLLINAWSTVGVSLDHHTHRTPIAFEEASSKVGMPKLLLLSSHTKDGSALDNIPSIKVTFSDGTEDFAILEHHNPFPHSKSFNPSMSHTYVGHMKSDPRELIAVTGCIQKDDDKMYVTLLSKRSQHHMRFSIDGKGTVDAVQSAKIPEHPYSRPKDTPPDTETPENQNRHRHKGKVPRAWDRAFRRGSGIVIPDVTPADTDFSVDYSGVVPFAMELKLKLGYEQSFHDAFDTDEERLNYLAEVVTHVKIYFREESFKHQIDLNFLGDPLYADNVFDLSGDPSSPSFGVDAADDWVYNNDNDVDTALYVFASAAYDGQVGVLGISRPQSVCLNNGTDPRRTSVTFATKTRPVVDTAYTMTHEIGHQLGIKHAAMKRWEDDRQVWYCLKAFNGEPKRCHDCTSIGPDGECCGGFMAPNFGENSKMGWSRCDVVFFETAYWESRWMRKRCLPAVEAQFPTPPPTLKSPTAESRFFPSASPKLGVKLYPSGPLKWEWVERSLVLDEGEDALDEWHPDHKGMSERTIVLPDRGDPESVGTQHIGFSGRTLAQCQKGCERLFWCHSITYREFDGACYWKKKCVTIDEPANPNPVWGWKSYFMPRDDTCGTTTPTVSPTFSPTTVEASKSEAFRVTLKNNVGRTKKALTGQCRNWKHWRETVGGDYEKWGQKFWEHRFDKITFSVTGPNIPSREFVCNGQAAHDICHTLQRGWKDTSTECDGNVWNTGVCGTSYALHVNTPICGTRMCGNATNPINAAGINPCIESASPIWGHAGAGCDLEEKTFEVICNPTAPPTPPPTPTPPSVKVDGLRMNITKNGAQPNVCVSELKFFLGRASTGNEVLSQRTHTKKRRSRAPYKADALEGVTVTTTSSYGAYKPAVGVFMQWEQWCSASNTCARSWKKNAGECPSHPSLTIMLEKSIRFDMYSVLGGGWFSSGSTGPVDWTLEGYDRATDKWRVIGGEQGHKWKRASEWGTFRVSVEEDGEGEGEEE